MADGLQNGTNCYREYGYAFRMNKLIRLYEHSLFWFNKYIGHLRISNEMLTNGDQIIYGELDTSIFRSLILDGAITGLRHHHWGYSWPYALQGQGIKENFSGFRAWRDGLLSATVVRSAPKHTPTKAYVS